jgi:hypothetical protein
MAHGEKQLGGYFVEKACHTAGIVQLLAGAVTGTGGGPGQAADIKRIHRTNGLWLGCFSCERYYYHCRKGERPISPEEQQRIARVFNAVGISTKPKFDRYEYAVAW